MADVCGHMTDMERVARGCSHPLAEPDVWSQYDPATHTWRNDDGTTRVVEVTCRFCSHPFRGIYQRAAYIDSLLEQNLISMADVTQWWFSCAQIVRVARLGRRKNA